ncbi:MAG: Na+:solute symporter [Planctomycetes bacterium GWF2_41_51]|nr:MAG: Na+:solute symporter [Planctomycetes bacterium GWF2_41_51]HBG27813.1 Na+:solute symporter [Phycisphaerales bacterium]
MFLHCIDWSVIIFFFVISLIVGIAVSRRAGKSSSEFFLSGRTMPWWLLGFSMVATTFSADTPNLVTDIVRQHGIAGNWVWYPFLLTGMLTVFIYAKLWRRSGVMTDVEFYEIRYSGKEAAFLRGFRALYLGVFFNIMIMASVTLAAIKIGGVMFNFGPIKSVLVAATVTVVFSTMGGLRGVLFTDFLLFLVAMAGSVLAAFFAIKQPSIGSIHNLITNAAVRGKLNFLPDFNNTDMVISLMIVPLAVQWWSVWYPGAEPGGGGYIAQRMLAAKNEKHATGSTLFFNIAHYALRPWPWFIVALSSLVIFPDLQSLTTAFPHLDPSIIKNDLAYPAMLTFLPHGILGLVVASLIAAYMSTMSTHLNWGSSYVVNDFYRRFVRPEASEKHLVRVGRISTVMMMVVASAIALWLGNALRAFNILLQIGAGTGLLFLLRWFWWRINAFSEITAMVVSFFVAIYFEFIHPALGFERVEQWKQLVIGVAITTVSWVVVTIFTRPTDDKTLRAFVKLINPGGPGWKRVVKAAEKEGLAIESQASQPNLPMGILCMFIGCVLVYSAIFATGFWIYEKLFMATVLTCLAAVTAVILIKLWGSKKLL